MPSPSLQFSVAPEYIVENGHRRRSAGPSTDSTSRRSPGGRAETYGRRYIFGFIDRTTVSTQFRVSYTFKPDVTLDVYAEPFAASGRYSGLGELAVSRGRDLRIYGTDGTTLDRAPDGSWQVTDGAAASRISNRRLQPPLLSAATSCCAGSGGRAARSTSSGSRTAGGRSLPLPPSASAISSARCRLGAITSWRSRRPSGSVDSRESGVGSQ